MSRYFADYLEHSWGNSPKQKAREQEYNAWYYKTHKDKFKGTKSQQDAIAKYNRRAKDESIESLRYAQAGDHENSAYAASRSAHAAVQAHNVRQQIVKDVEKDRNSAARRIEYGAYRTHKALAVIGSRLIK